jgi:hypothetical protein
VLTLETCKKMGEEREVRRVEDQQREDADFRKRSREFGYVVHSKHEKVIYVADNEPMSELQREGEPAEDEDEDEGGVTSDQYHDVKPVIDRATEEGVWSHPLFSAPLSLPNCCALSLNRHRELHLR